jgi:tetratricopeptide (TPR) repeat protein
MFNFSFKPSRSFQALCFAALLTTSSFAAEQAAVQRDYSVTDATGEVFAKYRVALDAKNYDGALALLDAQIAKVEAGSYDLALLYQVKAQTLVQKGDFPKSIEPLERTVALSDAKSPTYFEDKTVREFVYLLAQLYYQEAASSKNPSVAASYYDKADKALVRWLKIAKPTADALLIHAQILYSWASQDPDKPDLEIVKRALAQVEAGMHLATHPKDTFYVIKLVCLQQLNKMAEAAEILELIVKQKPDSAAYWQQLAAFYLSTNQETRAILTYERAQTHGFMAAPKDNINLVSVYFNLAQYEKAAELLENGLKNGKVENEIKNWELLAFCYQQLERPIKGIEALKSATKAFPTSGQMEFMIAQQYHSLEQPEAALPHAQAAVAKGNLTKPHQSYMFLAYIAFELKKFDIALTAAKKAAEFPEGAKDPQTQNMIKAIEETIKDREAKKNKA